MPMSAGKIWGMRRMADEHGRFKMTAVDQRPPIKNPIKEKRRTDAAPWRDVADVKALLVEELQSESSAMLLDPHFAYPHAISIYSPAKGLILTLEDSLFEETQGGRLSSEIDDWSVEKIKRVGGDAVKVLAWDRPDASPSVRAHQQEFTARIGEACAKYDIPFVFELLVYPLASDAEQTTDYIEMATKKPELVLESVNTFADPKYGVDLFKLESPLPATGVPGVGGDGADEAQRWFDALGEAAGRPWVMLSAGASMDAFRNILTHAYAAGASGYLAGRAIWLEAFQHFPDLEAMRTALRGKAIDYMRGLNQLTDEKATPWQEHPSVGGSIAPQPADHRFRHDYSGFGD
ncbi:MAG: tagatose 1,6-diphosphate aldolase [Pseudomonadota bacterium]